MEEILPVYNGGNFSPVMDQTTHQFHKWVTGNLILSMKVILIMGLTRLW